MLMVTIFRMLYRKEIHEISQLTKKFHRDIRRIVAQIREDIQSTQLTKEEIKTLVSTFGMQNQSYFIISYFRTSL